MDQQIRELNAAETGWLDELLAGLRADGVDPLNLAALTAYYDQAYAAWQVSGRRTPDPGLVINRCR
jgi:hypothetical protein